MHYCVKCRARLVTRPNGIDGPVPYCPRCQEFRFPKFSSAISAIIFNPDKTKVLLLEQYGQPQHILLAGYINPGENAKQALKREVKEETSLRLTSFSYNDNAYYQPHEVLMHNYAAVAASENVRPNSEIDSYAWVPVDQVLATTMPHSLAEQFVQEWFKKVKIA